MLAKVVFGSGKTFGIVSALINERRGVTFEADNKKRANNNVYVTDFL
jgi:hypothetical protein